MNYKALRGYGPDASGGRRDPVTVHMALCSDSNCQSDRHMCPVCQGKKGRVITVERVEGDKGVSITYRHSETLVCVDARPFDPQVTF